MSNETPNPVNPEEDLEMEEPPIITLEGQDGSAYRCQILDLITFEGNEYGILLKLGRLAGGDEDGSEGGSVGVASAAGPESGDSLDEDDDDEESLVIMQLIEGPDKASFRAIESDEEFKRVVEYVQELAQEAAALAEE